METITKRDDGTQVTHKVVYDRISTEKRCLTARSTCGRSFQLQSEAFGVETLTLSPDGQVISEVERDPNTNKQTGAMVYRKQP